MDHTPDKCPNRTIIAEIAAKMEKLEKEVHTIDKNAAVAEARQDVQYQTIIEMLTVDRTLREKLTDKVDQLSKRFEVNDYKTQKTTNVIDQITLGAIAKIIGLMTSVGLVATIFMEVWRK